MHRWVHPGNGKSVGCVWAHLHSEHNMQFYKLKLEFEAHVLKQLGNIESVAKPIMDVLNEKQWDESNQCIYNWNRRHRSLVTSLSEKYSWSVYFQQNLTGLIFDFVCRVSTLLRNVWKTTDFFVMSMTELKYFIFGFQTLFRVKLLKFWVLILSYRDVIFMIWTGLQLRLRRRYFVKCFV